MIPIAAHKGYSAETAWLQVSTWFMALPVYLFFCGFFRLPIAAVALILAAAMLFAGNWRIPHCKMRWRAVFIAASLVLLAWISALLPGYGGVFGPMWDFSKHILIFKELIHNPWPVHHACEEDALPCNAFLRYGLAYYILPALLAKLLPAVSPNTFIVSISTLYYLLLYSCAAVYLLHGKRIHLAVAVALLPILFLFGDFGTLYAVYLYGSKAAAGHNELVLNAGYAYFSFVSLARWMPQHAIPALYAALWYVSARRNRYSLAEGALPFFIVFAWSPLVAAGFAVLLLAYALEQRPAFIPAENHIVLAVHIILIAILGMILLMYYRAGSESIPHRIGLPQKLPASLLLNLGTLLPLCAIYLSSQKRIWLGLSAALCLIPLVHIGIFNDFIRYASAPLLLALKLMVLARFAEYKPRLPLYIVSWALLAVSAWDGMAELLYRGWPTQRIDAQTFDIQNVLVERQLSKPGFLPQYYAPCDSFSFIDCSEIKPQEAGQRVPE